MNARRLPRDLARALAALVVLGAAPAHAAPHGATSAAAAPAPPLPSADEVLNRVTQGNVKFASGHAAHPNQDSKRVAQTAEGQHPIVTVLSCSDSRVPPEILFDQGIGDVFSVRVAGNVADTDEMGSIEYGVDHLETPLLVVLGHTKCGAVTAVATHASVHGHIPQLVDNIQPAVDAARFKYPNATDADLVPEAIKINVFLSISDLISNSDAVRERVKAGKLSVVGAVYDIATGKVEWLGKHPEEAALAAEADKRPKVVHAPGKADPQDPHAKIEAKDGGASAGHDDGHGTTALASHAKDAHGKDGKDECPPPPPPNPLAFALVALVCVLGGTISGRLSAPKD